MERKCRECGAPLAGRRDKCFCSDDCRTAWHNRRYYQKQRPMAAVNRILTRNYYLLEAVYTTGLKCISLRDKRLNGFDRHYFTSVEKPLLGIKRYHLYEFAFSIRSGRICRLEREHPQLS